MKVVETKKFKNCLNIGVSIILVFMGIFLLIFPVWRNQTW